MNVILAYNVYSITSRFAIHKVDSKLDCNTLQYYYSVAHALLVLLYSITGVAPTETCTYPSSTQPGEDDLPKQHTPWSYNSVFPLLSRKFLVCHCFLRTTGQAFFCPTKAFSFPVAFLLRPESLAYSAVYFISHESKFGFKNTIPGAGIVTGNITRVIHCLDTWMESLWTTIMQREAFGGYDQQGMIQSHRPWGYCSSMSRYHQLPSGRHWTVAT